MNERQALLETILKNPNDLTPRLVYADWLDERGVDRDLAEFIRVQCGEPHPTPHYPGCRYSYHQHRMIDKRLGWVADLMRMLRPLARGGIDQENFGCYSWNDEKDGTVYMEVGKTRFTLRNGFVEKLRCGIDDLLAHGTPVLMSHPIREIELL